LEVGLFAALRSAISVLGRPSSSSTSRTWRSDPGGWKLYRVDGVRDQRRLVDGKPG
jgi:hypothetical protein